MARKSSNQITFTEQKKIIKINEWYLRTSLQEGVTRETAGWSLQAQAVNPDERYLWNYEEVVYSIGDSDVSDPILIGMYGTGTDGKGITDILNYYGVTQEPELPQEISNSFWKDSMTANKEITDYLETIEDKQQSISDVLTEEEISQLKLDGDETVQEAISKITVKLSSVNKYLWNYEKILYTDGSYTESDPGIIGVYGDSGEDAVRFQIYTTKGKDFKYGISDDEQLKEIILYVAAFKGSEPLTDVIFEWSYWDDTLNDGQGGDVIIHQTHEASFTVKDTDSYALYNLKCTMWYNNQLYEDYITLSTQTDIYSASINFFNGTNVLSQTQQYLIGYIDLYKNNKLEESASEKTNDYYIGDACLDKETGIITTQYVPTDTTNNLSYILCYSIVYTIANVTSETSGDYYILENGVYNKVTLSGDKNDLSATYYTDSKKYEVVLGEYDGEKWHQVNNVTKYIYQNDIDATTTSNVFLISKSDIGKSRNVNAYVYTEYTDVTAEDGTITTAINLNSIIATTCVTITDLNDVIFSEDEPTDVYEGQLWFDTKNNTLKIRSNGEWINTAKQKKGQDTYTNKPEYYEVGDLWIVAKKDEFDKFTEGSIWTAIKNHNDPGEFASHWSDAVPEFTALQDNLNYYFNPNKETGLRIGQGSNQPENQRFYVNITATKMSFCENPNVTVSNNIVESDSDPYELVYIGKDSATIRNLIVNNKADIDCPISIDSEINIVNTYTPTQVNYPGFTWKIEADGGLSLVHREVN